MNSDRWVEGRTQPIPAIGAITVLLEELANHTDPGSAIRKVSLPIDGAVVYSPKTARK